MSELFLADSAYVEFEIYQLCILAYEWWPFVRDPPARLRVGYRHILHSFLQYLFLLFLRTQEF